MAKKGTAFILIIENETNKLLDVIKSIKEFITKDTKILLFGNGVNPSTKTFLESLPYQLYISKNKLILDDIKEEFTNITKKFQNVIFRDISNSISIENKEILDSTFNMSSILHDIKTYNGYLDLVVPIYQYIENKGTTSIQGVNLFVNTFGIESRFTLNLNFISENGDLIYSGRTPLERVKNNSYISIKFKTPIDIKNNFLIKISKVFIENEIGTKLALYIDSNENGKINYRNKVINAKLTMSLL